MSLDYVSNQEIIQAAHRNLPQDVWDYLSGGAESETTMRRNRLGFDSIALRPRVLVDVSKIDTSTVFLGKKLRIPVHCKRLRPKAELPWPRRPPSSAA